MKDKLKNTLEHEVELLGRSISVLAIAGLLIVGGASAALLNNFGTVSGTADVQQSVTVDDQTATAESGPEIDTSFDTSGDSDGSTVTAGNLVTSEHVVRNNAGRTTSVAFEDTTDDGDIDTYQVIAERWEADGDDAFDVDVEATRENSVDGEFALQFTSDGETNDYAITWFEAPDTVEGVDLTYQGLAEGSNPLADEVWVRESDGDTYYLPNTEVNTDSTGEGLTTVTASLSDGSWINATQSQENPEWSEVTAVGIGQGSPQAEATYTVNTYVDNVQVGGSSVDEVNSQTLPIAPTGTFEGIDTNYRYVQVTPLDIALLPGDYEVSSVVTTPDDS